MRVDPEFMQKAKEAGLPLIRVQIDWRYVSKDKRPLKAHETSGYTSMEIAAELLKLCMQQM
jgi:hypothetical protein